MARLELKRPNCGETQTSIGELRHLETVVWSSVTTSLFPDVTMKHKEIKQNSWDHMARRWWIWDWKTGVPKQYYFYYWKCLCDFCPTLYKLYFWYQPPLITLLFMPFATTKKSSLALCVWNHLLILNRVDILSPCFCLRPYLYHGMMAHWWWLYIWLNILHLLSIE